MEFNDIQQMNDLTALALLKEKLKDQVVDRTISWQRRMFLYSQITKINKRIFHLQNLQEITPQK